MSGQQSLGDDYLAQQPRGSVLNTNVVVVVLLLLFLAIFLILMIHLYARLVWSRTPTFLLIRGRLAAARSQRQPAAASGLDAATIAALPTFTYAVSVHAAAAAAAADASPLLECAVCLSEFQENEKGRLLPPCKHAFHTQCIDMWFSSHSTCPLCRTDVLPAGAPADDQHQPDEEQEAAAQSLDTEESPANRRTAQLPCNVLVWGDGAHVTSTHEPSFSSPAIISSLTADSGRPRTRALPQITINIPPMDEGVVLTTPRRYSFSKSACLSDEHAAGCSSQPASISRSPGLGASLKRILSRKLSGHGVLAHEGSHHH